MLGISPLIHTSTLFGYAELADSLGLNTDALMAQQGLTRSLLQDPNYPISVYKVRALMENSAQASRLENFGLRLGASRRLANLGTIGIVMREELTGLAALRTLCRYLQLVGPSLYIAIDEYENSIIIREELAFADMTNVRQSIEMSLAVMVNILRELLGTEWRAQSVQFSHRAPKDQTFHHQTFKCPLQFNAEFNGIVCTAADLQRQLPDRNARLGHFVQASLDKELAQTAHSKAVSVLQLIKTLLLLGRCNAQTVATHLCISERTLHRHLTQEGHSFSSLLQQARQDLVTQQLRDSDRSITDIAQLLSFESTSAFAHWFQKSFGISARNWRQQQKPD